MNRITINGKTYEATGSISVINGRVSVNGTTLTETEETVVRIEIEGNLTSLTTDASVSMKGNVTGNVDAGGSVSVGGNITGNVDAGGSVNCGNVSGSVDAGGSVNCRRMS
jgi:GTPase